MTSKSAASRPTGESHSENASVCGRSEQRRCNAGPSGCLLPISFCIPKSSLRCPDRSSTSLPTYPKLNNGTFACVNSAIRHLTYCNGLCLYVGALNAGFTVCTARQAFGYLIASTRQILKPLIKRQYWSIIHARNKLTTLSHVRQTRYTPIVPSTPKTPPPCPPTQILPAYSHR